MAGIIIKPRSRIFHGHDWVYSSEIQKLFGNPEAGEVITMKDFKDRPLGTAIYNPESTIVARRISRRKEKLDRGFFERRLARASDLRDRLDGIDTRLCRLAWSEADGLPGVVIDRYGDDFVLQTLTLAMDRRKELIAEVLRDDFGARSVVERNDSPIRKAEGMELVTGILHGEAPAPAAIEIAGDPSLTLQIDLAGGQKTGLYLDQLTNYSLVAQHAKGRRVLDCFCNQGGFGLAAAAAGATEVIGVDQSEDAVAMAEKNAGAMGLENTSFLSANAFDHLRSLTAAEEVFDMVVLDPPSFARNKRALNEAMRGYKEIHLRALKLLRPGGLLMTFSCSHHVGAAGLREVACRAAVDAKRTLREVAIYRQRPDHPVIPTIPETEYLHGYALEVVGGF